MENNTILEFMSRIFPQNNVTSVEQYNDKQYV